MMQRNPCSGCKYYFGDYIANRCCNYIFVEGHRRPCPPGDGCTAKVIGPAPFHTWGRCARTLHKREPVMKLCARCGDAFYTNRSDKLYCCDACQERAKSARAYQRKKDRQ